MNNENKEIVVKNNPNEVIQITDDLIVEYMEAFGIAKELGEEQKKQFIQVAKSFQLNPFKREIYAIPYKGKDNKTTLSLVVGYEVYLKRAERSGKLAGWNIRTEGKIVYKKEIKQTKDQYGNKKDYEAIVVDLEKSDLKAICEIYRKDWSTSLIHEVIIQEYFQNNQMWNSKPHTMLKKVAIAQAFRLAFPDELGGMPYTAEEQWETQVIDKLPTENNHQVVKQDIPIDVEVKTEVEEKAETENIENQKKIEEPTEKNEDISSKNTEKIQNQQEKETNNYQIIKNIVFPIDFTVEEKSKKDGNTYWLFTVKVSNKKIMKLYLFDKKIYDKINEINGKLDFHYIEKEKNGKSFYELIDVSESIPF